MNVRGMKQNCYNIARIACVCVWLSGSEGLQVHAPCRGKLRAAIFKRVAQILPEYLWRDFVTCREMLLPTYLWGILLPKFLWGDLVTKEPVVGFCYQSTCGGILLPKYLWWDFVTKVPVGGFVTKIPVGGSGNLELLCPKANCFLGGFVGSLHGAMLPSSTCGAQPLNVTGGAQPLKRDGPQKSEQGKTFLAVQIFRAQPLNTRNRLAKCQPSSVHFDSTIRGKSKHSCTCQPVYLPLRKCRSK